MSRASIGGQLHAGWKQPDPPWQTGSLPRREEDTGSATKFIRVFGSILDELLANPIIMNRIIMDNGINSLPPWGQQ